ncbi:hypothetical protein [Ramlibacter tataouinensis]|uniref:Uncharacterized protein n=1 Tax=Ramlibacter tataouinensis TaxID=94132 RepID=A0A127JRS5_9BURK|nr:hypothetical protein [Ramlibacter tataouinensis]AMO22734.1 hypothetical protein UC35_07365 [Ramlibacter tataouinensis]
MTAEYRQYLIQRFDEEVEGESFFRGLSVRAEGADRKHKWAVLAQLEAETREHLRTALKELGVEPADQAHRVERGQKLAERFSAMPWLEFLLMFRTTLENFMSQFSAAEKLAPEEGKERALLRHITRHEQALLAFVVREIDGRGDVSTDAVLALLGKPIQS